MTRLHNRRRLFRLGLIPTLGLATTIALIHLMGSAGAIAADGFEITDGNVADQVQPVPLNEIPDWDTVFGPGGVVEDPAGTLDQIFIIDPLSFDPILPSANCPSPLPGKKGDTSVFTGFGSDKNGMPFSTLTYATGNVPNNKDDLSNVYALIKPDPADGSKVIHWALERVDNKGSSHVDFEFLKAFVGLGAPEGLDANGCPFGHWVGTRSVGDLIISMDFLNGGTLGMASVRRWNGSSYVEIPISTFLPGNIGIVQNGSSVSCGNWTCRNTNGLATPTLITNAFVEGFLDLGDPTLTFTGCITSFNAHSRSSHSFTSTLKDFAFGGFNTCDAHISVGQSGVNEVGTPHPVTGHVDVKPGETFQNAPDGTVINFSLSGSGSLSSSSCVTSGGTGSCSVTLSSSTAGVSVVTATTTVVVEGAPLTRTTDGTGGNSPPLTKRWVDASIEIGPSAANEVGDAHTFLVTVTAIPSGATPVSFDSIVPSVTPATTILGSTCGSPSVSGNVATCSFSINSSAAEVFTANASADVTMGGVTVSRSTSGNSGPGGSGPATKTYADASISLTPLAATNEVGDPHTVTATVTQNDGGTAGPSPDGTLVVFSLLNNTAGASFVGGDNDCETAAGQCAVAINASSAGSVDIHATTTFSVGGVSLTRSTGTTGNSSDANKIYVDASISLTPLAATNEVGDPHTVTATVTQNDGGTAGPAPDGTLVVFSLLNNTAGASFVGGDNDCETAAGQCAVAINASSAGSVDIHATTTFSVGGVSLTRSTGTTGNSSDANKIYVDASISLTPLAATNEVGDPHTVTATVTQNDGGTAGPAPDGTLVVFSLLNNTAGASFVGGDNDCETAAGQCAVTINASSAGSVDIHATTTFAVGGVSLTRSTGTTGNSSDANKIYVDASIEIGPSAANEVGDAHTFLVTVTAIPSGATPVSFDSIVPSVTPATTILGSTCGSPSVSGNVATCSFSINSSAAEVFTANASADVTMGGVTVSRSTSGNSGPGGSGPATKTYADASISLTPLAATNEVGDPHTVTATVTQNDGGTAGPSPDGTLVVFSLLNNTAGASFVGGDNDCETAAGQCAVAINASSAGSVDIHATTTFAVGGVSLTRSTGTTGNSSDANKIYVDASISLTPLAATNEVGDPHTVTATVTQNDGGTAGPAPDGTLVVFSLLNNTAGASFVGGDNDCETAAGQCAVAINASSAGSVDIHATTTFSVGGVSLTRSTGTTGNSSDANKIYVDASISLTPLAATNEVGDPHTVTATVTQNDGGTVGPAPDGTLVVFSLLNNTAGASFVGGDNDCETAAGQCAVAINASSAGSVDIHATTTFAVGGVSLTRSTGTTGNSSDANKIYVDASIEIGPPSAVNEVGDAHTFLVTVTAIPSGATPVSFDSIVPSVTPATTILGSTCGSPSVSGNVATCSFSINSSAAEVFTANASADVTMGGVTVSRSTSGNSGPGGSGPATKTYADASISLTPLAATNEVGDPHTVTATVTQNDGGTVGPSPDGTLVVFSLLNNTAGASFVGGDNDCETAAGQCAVAINASSAGSVDIHATATFVVNGVEVTRSTGTTGNSSDANKIYVDASISLTPLAATNEVGKAHTVTATVTQNDEGTLGPAPDGTLVVFSLLNNTAGASFVGGDNDCATTGGSCSVQINSSAAGAVDIHATATFVVNGVELTRATGTSGNSSDASKLYVDYRVTVEPDDVNLVGEDHTFNVKVERDEGSGFQPLGGAQVSLNWNGPAGSGITGGTCQSVTDTNGMCTVVVNSPVPGSGTLEATFSTNADSGSIVRSDTATKTWLAFSLNVTPEHAQNDVRHPHVFTVTLTRDSGSGHTALQGESLDLSLDPDGTDAIITAIDSGTIDQDGLGGTCTTNSAGQCLVTVNSTKAGTITLTASFTKMIGQNSRATETDSATKTYLDARLSKESCPPRPSGTHGQVVPGQEVQYSLRTITEGDALTNSTLVDQLPGEAEFLSAGSGGAYDPNLHTVNWTFGTLPAGDDFTVTLTARILEETPLETVVTNAATFDADVIDPRVATSSLVVSNEGALAEGRAYGVSASVLGGTEELPPDPDTDADNPATREVIEIPGILTANLLNVVNTSLVEPTSAEDTAIATTSDVTITLPGVTITAKSVVALSRSYASGFTAGSTFVGSKVQDLVINGVPYGDFTSSETILVNHPITGDPFATVRVLQTTESGAALGIPQPEDGLFRSGLIVRGIRVELLDQTFLLDPIDESTEVVVGYADSRAHFPSALACGEEVPAVFGDAYVLFLNVPNAIHRTGLVSLPSTGGNLTSNLADLSPFGIGSGTSHTEGSLVPLRASSFAEVLDANLFDGLVTSQKIRADSTTESPDPTTLGTIIADLHVLGVDVCEALSLEDACTPPPDSVLVLPGGPTIVVLNEQAGLGGRVNAVHIYVVGQDNPFDLPAGAQVIISSAFSATS